METMVILRAQKRSIVLVPFPYQGHTTPMLQLGKILHSRGFSIIVAHTKFNSLNTLNHPEFLFLPLEDNVSAGLDTSIGNISAVITAINENCKVSLRDSLAQMMKDRENHGHVCCIIYDAVMHFSRSVANHLNISSMVLGTFSAFYMQTHHTILRLGAENSIPLQESRMLEPVPELHALRFKDLLIPVNTEIPQTVLELLKDISNIGSSIGIIWNTTEDLDHRSLSELRQLYKVPIFPIGPFHKIVPASSTSFLKEDTSCMAWLDKQAPNSVLYISLGSLACIEEKELEETAWGLAKSGQPFLWVVRPCSVNGSNWIEQLPNGFQDCIGERGQIVKWAPQKEVLGHPAVGGFLTHCGWNSTLESLCEAVPMICRPCFADQMANARYITHVWKVGLELEEVNDREVIGKSIKRLMIENEGKQVRQRVLDMKQKLDTSMKKSGASYESLSDLTDFINSFPL